MVEVKSVKVDNWGVFFLQKLQNFFNKTDYCDLTLQFKDNSQLKVHRLVLSACTDFFNVLETKYNVTDDILVMPKDLQADVVVPIVNFMYTGTLEFEVSMYAKLLKTAREMNMTVLLKLLDAHKRTVGEALRTQPAQPILLNKGAMPSAANQRVNTYSRPTTSTPRAYATARKQTIVTSAGAKQGAQQRTVAHVARIKTEQKSPGGTIVRTVPAAAYLRKALPDTVQLVAKYANSAAASGSKGPSRFECVEDSDAFESSFDNISYESKPLITSKEDKDADGFDLVKRTAAGALKRAYTSPTLQSPPEKRPNIQDIKELSEAHRARKEIAVQEPDDDQDYFDDFQNDDDDEEYQATVDESRSNTRNFLIKTDSPNINAKKIMSDLLQKHPNLKNNKNIRLKIMSKGAPPMIVSAVTSDPTTITTSKQQAAAKQTKATTVQARLAAKTELSVSKIRSQPIVRATVTSTPTSQKVVTAPAATSSIASTRSAGVAATSTPQPQTRKIDSRTMHALLAQGAENTTGPWLCLECGQNGRPISIPTYSRFRRHLIQAHKQKIDPRLCEHCGHRSQQKHDLNYHMLIKHDIPAPKEFQYPKCGLCSFVALDQQALRKHKDEDHQAQSSQQLCIYCNKSFQKEIQLYAHMRANHRERAQEDGVMDFTDEENFEDEADKYVPNHPEATQSPSSLGSKIKVLSNIQLPNKAPFITIDSQGGTNVLVATTTAENIQLEPSSEAEGLSNVASGIATSLAVLDSNVHLDETVESYEDDLQSQYIEAAMADVHGEILSQKDDTQVVTKFITEEGSELELTAAQKVRLLEQLQGQTDLTNNVVMVLDGTFEHTDESIQQQSEQIGDENDTSADVALVDDGKVDGESMEWQEGNDAESADESKNDESADAESAEESAENLSADESSQEGIADADKSIDTSNKAVLEKQSPKEAAQRNETGKRVVKARIQKKVEDSADEAKDEGDVKNEIITDWDSQHSVDGDEKEEAKDDDEEENDSEAVESSKIEASKNGGSVTTEKKVEQKDELKTLINDWGDDDEDNF